MSPNIQLFSYIRTFVDHEISNDYDWVIDSNYDWVIDKFWQEMKRVSDEDFIIILLNPFIPDTYRTNGTKEKLFTKLIEVVFAEWCRRIWFDSYIVKQKSNIEDVRFILPSNKAILTDVKTFRLWRSQKAPNHKDFLKLESVRHWIHNFNSDKANLDKWFLAIWGMVVYTQEHEWEGNSDVYSMCSNLTTPTLMLPYNYLSLLLEHKEHFNIADLEKLWDYSALFPISTNSRSNYWTAINEKLLEILWITEIETKVYLDKYESVVNEFIAFTKELLLNEKANIKQIIIDSVWKITDPELIRAELIEYKTITETESIEKIMVNINKFR